MDLSDSFGNAKLPVYVLNVTYPLIPDEVRDFCAGKRAVLIVEEGQPEFIEHELNTILRRADLNTRVVGKEVLPRAGEYTAQVVGDGVAKFLAQWGGMPAAATRAERPSPRSPGKCRSGPRASAPAARSGRCSRR